MPEKNKRLVAVVNDLLFRVKIAETAKRAGLDCIFVDNPAQAFEVVRAQKPSLVIMDLNLDSKRMVDLITRLKKEEETRGISLLGYVSHVQADVKKAALDAGCDVVLARSAFSQNLPQILRRHSGTL